MPIRYQEIRTDRQWQSATGLSEVQFHKLVALFKRSYEWLFEESLAESQKGNDSVRLKSYGDLLFFGLYSLKSGLTYDLLGLSFGMSNSNVYEKQALVLRVLEHTLGQGDYLPKRSFASEEEFINYLKEEPQVLIDATEQRVQRAGNQSEQRADYSGKKKPTP